jgi:hypothetical protein
VSFHFIVPSSEAVDEVMGNAVAAGGGVVKEAAASQWGGYFGYFSDPDGYLLEGRVPLLIGRFTAHMGPVGGSATWAATSWRGRRPGRPMAR